MKFDIKLPNEHSTVQTPGTLRIDVHYANLLLVERWDYPRFARLCAFLQISEAELASLVLMPHNYLPAFKLTNKLHHRRPVALPIAMILTLLELHCCGAMTKDVIVQPFPDLNAQQKGS